MKLHLNLKPRTHEHEEFDGVAMPIEEPPNNIGFYGQRIAYEKYGLVSDDVNDVFAFIDSACDINDDTLNIKPLHPKLEETSA
jgi:hypothetical protein